jgi:geranylgeranylglycerol-phosphate geranylgeranyltransferase
MNFEAIRAYGQLVRPMNGGIVFVTITIAALLAGATEKQGPFVLLGSLAGLLIAAGGNAINDYFDVAIDRINRPHRPLARGAVGLQGAWWTWRILSSLGVLASAYIGPYTFAISLFWVVTLYWYSKSLKRTVLWGNLVVALATGLALLYGGFVAGNVQQVLVPALFAFLVNLARELVKDSEDVEGDARGGARTMAVRHGVSASLGTASVVLVLLIAATIVPYIEGMYNAVYFIVVLLVDILLLYSIISMWQTRTPKSLARVSRLLKLSMMLGIVAIALGSYPWT